MLQRQGFDISYSSVVLEIKRIKQLGNECFIKQDYEFGDRLEYDFGEVKLVINSITKKYYIAVLSSPAGNFRWCYLYDNCKKDVFLDSHVRFFKMIGGVWKEVVYDNMRNVVSKFIGKNEKELNEDLIKMSIYYGFEINVTNAFSGNEKGYVEGSVKYLRFSGDSYETQRQEIANYKEAEPEPENSTGVMTRGDIHVTYYYERKPSGIITVKYVDIDTNEEILYKDAETGEYLPYREQLQGLCGLEYEVEQKEIPYYNLVEDQMPENTSGIYTEDDLEIIFYYKKQEFNLKVEKQITRITVNGQEHSLNEELDQIDVVSSKVSETNIEVTYKIIVSNTAEIEGTATVIENIPNYFSVVENGSQGWNTVDGNLQTNEVTLENISNPANFAESNLDDNQATAEVMLSVKTGGTDTLVYTILDFGLSFIILIGNILLLGTRSKNRIKGIALKTSYFLGNSLKYNKKCLTTNVI